MIKFDDIPNNITSNRLAKLIVNDVIKPYQGRVLPNEIKTLIKRIFTEDKFQERIYKRPLEEGERVSYAWKVGFKQIIGKEKTLLIERILKEEI